MEEIKKQLDEIYRDIHKCHKCPDMCPSKELRRSDAVNPHADVFIISQALAENTLRKTGVQFFDKNGEPGDTGRNLEKFLNQFNRTIYPPSLIELGPGVRIRARKPEFLTVYNTDLAQCYPGKKKTGKGGDRKPKKCEVEECTNAGFIQHEMEIIKPKLVLLMGTVSTNSFFEFFGKYMTESCWHKGLNLEEHINQIVKQRSLPIFQISTLTANVCPIYHASGANNGRFPKMIQTDLINLLAGALK